MRLSAEWKKNSKFNLKKEKREKFTDLDFYKIQKMTQFFLFQKYIGMISCYNIYMKKYIHTLYIELKIFFKKAGALVLEKIEFKNKRQEVKKHRFSRK